MYNDSQTVTIDTDAISLVRTGSSLNRGEYRSADGQTVLAIQHTRAKRNRSVVRLDITEVVPDPLTEGSSVPTKYGVWVVVDYPANVVLRDRVVDTIDGLVKWLTPSHIEKFVNTEV